MELKNVLKLGNSSIKKGMTKQSSKSKKRKINLTKKKCREKEYREKK